MRRFHVGDRVELLKGKQGGPAGTVVRIVEEDGPQIVAVCWDGDDALKVSVMPAAVLMMSPS
jgi:hypothetical protein